jgi:hypothetical protein
MYVCTILTLGKQVDPVTCGEAAFGGTPRKQGNVGGFIQDINW